MDASKENVEHKQLTLDELDGVAGGESITRGQLAPPTNFAIQSIGTHENQALRFFTVTLQKLDFLAHHFPFPGAPQP